MTPMLILYNQKRFRGILLLTIASHLIILLGFQHYVPSLCQENKTKISLKTNPPSIAFHAVASATELSLPSPTLASYEEQETEYLARWQSYVEHYGNTHYPKKILKNNLHGQLQLMVAIRRDGSLENIAIVRSSGSPILDQAAMDIVLAAAPFAPLPAHMTEEIDVLKIIRTWAFKDNLSTFY